MQEIPKRKTIRLTGYDYSQSGAYFITICTINRAHLLGRIVVADDSVLPPALEESEVGQIVRSCWNNIENAYKYIKTDKFCIMPNHIHGIILIEDSGGQSRPPLQKIVQGFKSVTTRICFEQGYKRLWQRSYHDHIIRNDEDYREIWAYIDTNPAKWVEDKYYTYFS